MNALFKIFFFLSIMDLLSAKYANSQSILLSDLIVKKVAVDAAYFPKNIMDAYDSSAKIVTDLDGIDLMFNAAYPALADRMNRRSAKLNSLAGYSEPNAVLTLVPFNQEMSAFFRQQWESFDAAGKNLDRQVKPFYGKELYKSKGYIPVWDSVYKSRIPALRQYHKTVLTLVKKELAYLQLNAKMYSSKIEEEKMQYVEAEIAILQKLVLVISKYKQVIVEDGIEKVKYCISLGDVCQVLLKLKTNESN